MVINKGDTIGIIALSGECDKTKVKIAQFNLESLGYKVKFSKNIYDKNRYLAGNDSDKIKELQSFFEDDEIKLILTARGGYGTVRLINNINYELIKNHPKPFCGFSDATALLLMIYKKTGIITYHSPMACSDFGLNDYSTFTVNNFFTAINSSKLEFEGEKTYNSGSANGIIWGGNLSTVVSLCGQDFIPEKDFIFFTEDLNEPVYKIDKMFNQLFNISQFKNNCKGIVLGDFTGIDNQVWFDEFIKELAKDTAFPITTDFKITHNREKITIPIGASASLDGYKLRLLY